MIVNNLPEPKNDDRIRVLRKRLSHWLEQGFLKLYLTKTVDDPTFCLSTQLSHRIAFQLRGDNNDERTQWFQTRSERAVNHVFQKLQLLKGEATVVTASMLEDFDTVVIFPDPSWRSLDLKQLCQKLGIAGVLQESRVQKIVYSDRYLNSSSAKILASLLPGSWLDNDSHLTIRIQQLKQEYDQQDTRRSAEIEQTVATLPGKIKVEMQPYFQRHQPLPHRRELTIQLQGNLTYRIIFD